MYHTFGEVELCDGSNSDAVALDKLDGLEGFGHELGEEGVVVKRQGLKQPGWGNRAGNVLAE